MSQQPVASYVAFDGDRRIAAGSPSEVVRAAKKRLDQHKDVSILIFDTVTGGPIAIDFRGSVGDILARFPGIAGSPSAAEAAALSAPRGPGRPRLGVVAREVTLLPRHWEWLAQQPGGVSVALRRLVEQARRSDGAVENVRRAHDAAFRFMTVMAGDRPNYAEAIRALFANEAAHFNELIAGWPADVRDYTLTLAEGAFRRETEAGSS
jgi:uncharacterized protein